MQLPRAPSVRREAPMLAGLLVTYAEKLAEVLRGERTASIASTLRLGTLCLAEARASAAARLLEQHGTFDAAAEASGISRRTLLRWKGQGR